MSERYSIEVNDYSVEIYGDLTIEETFDFLSFFERKGYKSVVIGCENSTLRMVKKDQEEIIESGRNIDLKYELQCIKNQFESEKKDHEKCKEKLTHTESTMKILLAEQNIKFEKLKKENENFTKEIRFLKIKLNPEVDKLIEKLQSENNHC